MFLKFMYAFPDNNHLRIVCDNWKPYQYPVGNSVKGYSAEIINTVMSELDVQEFSVNAYPWKRALKMLQTGKADALFSANYTSERDVFAYYPEEPLIESPWVIWTNSKSSNEYFSFSDLKGKTVGIVIGYSYTEEFLSYIRRYSDVEETVYDSQNFKKLKDGRLDYIIAEYGNGLSLLSDLQIDNVIPWLENPVKMDGLYIIFNKSSVSKTFVKEFSEKTKQFKKTKEYRKLYIKYFGDGEISGWVKPTRH